MLSPVYDYLRKVCSGAGQQPFVGLPQQMRNQFACQLAGTRAPRMKSLFHDSESMTISISGAPVLARWHSWISQKTKYKLCAFANLPSAPLIYAFGNRHPELSEIQFGAIWSLLGLF